MALVEKQEFHWFWKGPYRDGQGRASFKGCRTPAKKVAYILFVGEVPAGMAPYQTCDDKRCVRPDHLGLRPRYTWQWLKPIKRAA